MDVRPGDRLRIRDAHGDWHPAVARSGVFLNTEYVSRRQTPWLVVQVDHVGFEHPVNWPVDDVALLAG